MPFDHSRCNRWQTHVVLQMAILLGSITTVGNHGCSRSPSATSNRSAHEAVELASRAESLFKESKFDEGVDTLLRAIAANPDDAGRDLAVVTSSTLDEVELHKGEQQLRRMLADRPEMALCLKPGDDLWNWVVRKFAGEDSGRLLMWDAKDPKPFECDSVTEQSEIWLQVGDREDCTGEQECDALWASTIFELYRAAASKERQNLKRRLQAGDIAAEDYAREQMGITERARERTRAFYLKLYAPMRLASGAKELWPEKWHCYEWHEDKA